MTEGKRYLLLMILGNADITSFILSRFFNEPTSQILLQVFQKVGNCIPMTWLNCTLEEYTVPFTIMRPNCTSDGNVCWKNCTTVPDTKMMPQMDCEVKVE